MEVGMEIVKLFALMESGPAALARLGTRALHLVLKHEWAEQDRDGSAGYGCCECDRWREQGHTSECEWGKLCAEVRKLAGIE